MSIASALAKAKAAQKSGAASAVITDAKAALKAQLASGPVPLQPTPPQAILPQEPATPVRDIEFAQHETQPDSVDPAVLAQYRQSITQLEAGFGHDKDHVSSAIYNIMNFVQIHPELKDNILPDDIGLIVSQLEDVAGTIVRGKAKASTKRKEGSESRAKVDGMMGGMLDDLFGAGS